MTAEMDTAIRNVIKARQDGEWTRVAQWMRAHDCPPDLMQAQSRIWRALAELEIAHTGGLLAEIEVPAISEGNR